MSDGPQPGRDERFADGVLACISDLNPVLLKLAKRYDEMVVVAALAEHVGGGLRIIMRRGGCTEEEARRVLKHMEEIMTTADLPDV